MQNKVDHLAIIMDGNRRWAKGRGLPPSAGHLAGYERLKQFGPECVSRGIRNLTVFAFSTENWKRADEEVGFLMDLFEKALTEELAEFSSQGFRLKVIGRRDGLRPSIVRAIASAEDATSRNTKATLALCINYGGRAEIVDACRRLVTDKISADEIDEAAIHRLTPVLAGDARTRPDHQDIGRRAAVRFSDLAGRVQRTLLGR